MLTIPIQVSGDVWNNRAEIAELLATLEPRTKILLDACSEGPSLRRLGVVDLVQQYDLDVWITRWSNSVETVPFVKSMCNSQSHFYPMSRHYWTDPIPNNPSAEFRFGLFLGRSTTARNRILYDAAHVWPGKFLLSKMSGHNASHWRTDANDADPAEWFDNVTQARDWFNACPVTSIDGHTIQDQYQIPELSTGQMMTKLITEHYSRFNIELACETYTLGETFFPTEKTTRPMVGNRPFIVYGPVNFLYNLRRDEGFKTFGHLWDESYDRLEGLARWQAISQLINNLLAMTDQQWTEVLTQATEITEHNRTVLKKIINDRKSF